MNPPPHPTHPPRAGDLGGGLSVGEDSGLVAGLDDGSDSDAGLGGVAAGGSSGSVF